MGINPITILIPRSKIKSAIPQSKKLMEITDQEEESMATIRYTDWMKQTNDKNNQKKVTVTPKMMEDTKHSIQDQAETVYQFQGLT